MKKQKTWTRRKPITKQSYGKSTSKLYNVWNQIKRRCTDSKHPRFILYGERGIKICEEWTEFENFYIWATNNGYKEGLSIDRIDPNGNYCPENCRWATWVEQENNKRTNLYITYKGETKTLSEWSRITGILKSTLRERLQRGWDIERLFEPIKK